MNKEYNTELSPQDALAVALMVLASRQYLTEEEIPAFETIESAIGGDPRRTLVIGTDESWEDGSDSVLITWTHDPKDPEGSVFSQVGRNTVIVPKPDRTLALKGNNLVFSLRAPDNPEGKRLLDLLIRHARERAADLFKDIQETAGASDEEPGQDFSDVVLEYDTTEILTETDRSFLIAILGEAIRRGLEVSQPSDDGFIYYRTSHKTAFGRQILQMRIGNAQQAGVASPEGARWIALSCRSGAGDAFTVAFPQDTTLDALTAGIIQKSASRIPMILLENDFTAERDHRLIHVFIGQSRARAEEFRKQTNGESFTPRAIAETLRRIVQESGLTREQRRRLDQRNRQKRKRS